MNLAQKAIGRGHWDKAVTHLEKVLAEEPNDLRTLLKLGDVYAKKGDRDQAIDVYRQVAEHHASEGFFLKAVAVYKQVFRLDAHHCEAALRLAELHEQLGLAQDAMSHYQLALPLLEERGEVGRSIEVLRRMVELEPENVSVHIKLAEACSRSDQKSLAVEHFLNAANILKSQARIEDYIKVSERLIYHDQSRLDVVKNLAKLYLSRGDTKRGLTKLQICFRNNPREVETLNLLAKAFADLGQTQKTIYVYRELARVHRDHGKDAEAKEVYRLILQHAPDDEEALNVLGMAKNIPAMIAGAPLPSSKVLRGQSQSPASEANPGYPFPQSPALLGTTGALPLDASRDLDHIKDDGWDAIGAIGADVGELKPRPSTSAALAYSGTSHPLRRSAPPKNREPSIEEEQIVIDGFDSDEEVIDVNDVALEEVIEDAIAEDDPDGDSATKLVVLSLDADGELAQQPSNPAPVDKNQEKINQFIKEADVYIRYNLPTKALEHLREASRFAPQSIEVLQKIRDVHKTLGEHPKATEITQEIYRIASTTGDLDVKAQALHELQSLNPNNSSFSDPFDDGLDLAAATIPPAVPSLDEDLNLANLVDDDFDSLGSTEATSPRLIPRADTSVLFKPPYNPPNPSHEDSLPDDVAEYEEDNEMTRASVMEDFDFEVFEEMPQMMPSLEEQDVEQGEVTEIAPSYTSAQAIEEELAELEFFIDQGIIIEAEEHLSRLRKKLGDVPRLRQIATKLDAARANNTLRSDEELPTEFGTDNKLLDSQIDTDSPWATQEDPEVGRAIDVLASRVGHDGYSVVATADVQQARDQYDQGMAFKEIGRLEDAVVAFETAALAAPERASEALEMLGHCRMEQHRVDEAIIAFSNALDRAEEGPAATNLRYELGRAYEAIGDLQSAHQWYESCSKLDPNHRDVQSRISQTSPDAALSNDENQSPSPRF